MANKALSITVDSATITGGSGKTSWANLTPCSLFRGVLQKGAQLTNLTAALSNDAITFSVQPYGESAVSITTAKSIMVDGTMLSIIRADGSSYSTYGKWYTSWTLSNCTPIKKGTGVYVRTLLPKDGKNTGEIGADGKFFNKAYINEIKSNQVYGAVVNPG